MGSLGFQESLLILFTAGLFIIPFVFFLLTLQNTLKVIEASNRKMEPGKVWLLFIPFFSFYWMFVVVNAIAGSSKLQLEQYGVYSEEKPTYSLGLPLAICYACTLIPIVNILASLAWIVLFILYWIKVNETKNQIVMMKQTFANNEENSIFK